MRMKSPQTLFIATATWILTALLFAVSFLLQTGRPSADVLARMAERQTTINVSDFKPGDIKFISHNKQQVIVWRRNAADKILAAKQNKSNAWRLRHSSVLGHADPVLAEDANLTLDGEWLFVHAVLAKRIKVLG
ncbi:MAG: hypothetical protein JXR13_04910 [Thalassovita sp.]